MKEIRAADLSHTVGNEVIWSTDRPTGAETPVQGDLCLATPEQRAEQHTGSHQERTEESRGQVQSVVVGGHSRAPLHARAHPGRGFV